MKPEGFENADFQSFLVWTENSLKTELSKTMRSRWSSDFPARVLLKRKSKSNAFCSVIKFLRLGVNGTVDVWECQQNIAYVTVKMLTYLYSSAQWQSLGHRYRKVAKRPASHFNVEYLENL